MVEQPPTLVGVSDRSQDPGPPAPQHPAPQHPAQVDTAPIIVAGTVLWAVALVVTLVVPALHTGPRAWWPWTAVTGLVLGGIGLLYVLRGRGSAAGARPTTVRHDRAAGSP